MPTRRNRRYISDNHPTAQWLFRALEGEVVLELSNPREAANLARRLCYYRDRARIAPPGTFPETAFDPCGEGIGTFDNIAIGIKDNTVHLYIPIGGDHRTKIVEPKKMTVA